MPPWLFRARTSFEQLSLKKSYETLAQMSRAAVNRLSRANPVESLAVIVDERGRNVLLKFRTKFLRTFTFKLLPDLAIDLAENLEKDSREGGWKIEHPANPPV